MMRRPLLVAGASLVALLGLAPLSWAQTAGNWDGSTLDTGPSTVTQSAYTLSGTFRHSPDRQIQVRVSAAPAGSGACAIAPVTLAPAPTPRAFNVTLSIPCNGTYSIVATATTTDNSAVFPADSASLNRSVQVSGPAPTVTGVSAAGAGRTVTVTWDDMTQVVPDVSRYIVQRQGTDGSFADLATVDAATQTYTDNALPDAGGDIAYQVLATRPSPSGERVSAASSSATTQYDAAPRPTTTTGGSGGTTGTPGDGSPSGGTSGGTAGSGGYTTPGGTPGGVSAPRVYSGTFLPPLLRPATQTLSPPTTADTGFTESLPYEKGSKDAVLPGGDSLASVDTQGQAGRGLVIPVATALVLAVWAIHLRMLARAARPVI